MPSSRKREPRPSVAASRFTPRLRKLLAVALLAGSSAICARLVKTPPASLVSAGGARRPREFDGAIGPWGKLHYKRIWIEPPLEVLGADRAHGAPRWFFGGFTAERLTELMRSLGLAAPATAAVTDVSRWRATSDGIWVMPPLEVAESLTPETRTRLYEVLEPFPENRQHAPVALRPELLDEQLAAGRLATESEALVRRLLYPRHGWMMFADEFLALALIRDQEQRARLLDVLTATATYLVTVDLNADVDALTRYWSLGVRPDDRAALLRAAAQVPGGSTIELEDLLPAFARRLLYTYPNRALDPALDRRNCFWTSLNFFSDTPDDRLADLGAATRAMETDYELVKEPAYGDLLVLVDARNTPVHAAVYLADDLVFTKNGGAQLHPWLYMKIPDLLDRYALFAHDSGGVKATYRRRRPPSTPQP
jgi:hypothetical protein